MEEKTEWQKVSRWKNRQINIPLIGLPILLQEIGGPIVEIYKSLIQT
jgi:hypothetical protein